MRAPRRIRSDRTTQRDVESRLRVIGGELRGRTIHYNGDSHLRPMKDRVREAVFNLVGPRVVGKHVLDLFAGTGAMTFESLSRRAASGTLIEQRFPNVDQIKVTAKELGLIDRVTVTGGDTFIWVRRASVSTALPWLVFCCPPYELYQTRQQDLIDLLQRLWTMAPVDSVFVVESDERIDPATMIQGIEWDVRQYHPSVIGLVQKQE
jgi:16S rRNA (guanine966-N2)-methyltransferase